MKKKIVAIMACAMMLLSAGASAEMTAGTYTGEGQGIGGAVKVAVTVEGGAITAVEVVEHAETAGICDPAIEKIPAAIVAAQSLAVDTVTGHPRRRRAGADRGGRGHRGAQDRRAEGRAGGGRDD